MDAYSPQAAPQLGDMISGIQRWVEQESPTSDRLAVNRMIDLVISDLADLPITMERVPGQHGCADTLVVCAGDNRDRAGILLLAHVDTVHPIGTLAGTLPFHHDGDRLYGPGLYDMKAGAYMALEAFRRVVRAQTAQLPITFLFTPDEEIGSPSSRAIIEAEARRARYALVAEPARDGGKIVTARKGVARFDVTITGIPAHAGSHHERGRSAIKEAARQILAIEAMTDYGRDVTTTVGVISGGTAPNVIPQRCTFSVDLRIADQPTGQEMVAKILGLKPFDPDVKIVVTGGLNRPPYEKTAATEALFHHAQGLARELDFELVDVPRVGGGSDGNFTAALGVATLDGLGIDGDGAHTDWEYGLASSIVPRTLLLQRLLETLH